MPTYSFSRAESCRGWADKEQAVAAAERAMRLNPLNPHFPDWYHGSVRGGYFHAGQFEQALLASKKRQNITFWDFVFRPLCYAQLGRDKETEAPAAELLQRASDDLAEKFLSDVGTCSRVAELKLFVESNRKAGLPVCATEAQLARYFDMKRLDQCEAERASG
jgi:hypothetical protein